MYSQQFCIFSNVLIYATVVFFTYRTAAGMITHVVRKYTYFHGTGTSCAREKGRRVRSSGDKTSGGSEGRTAGTAWN